MIQKIKEKSKDIDNQSYKKCPFCGSEILEEAIKCKVCHHWLNTHSARGKEHEIKELEKIELIKCPCCAEEIPNYTVICKHCLQNVHTRKANRMVYKLKEDEKLSSYYQPIWLLVILSAFTLNFYQVYWFFRNWKFMRVHMKLNVHPLLNTASLFVPVLGFISIYRQLRSINVLAQRKEVGKYFSPLVFLFVWSIFLFEGIIFLLVVLITNNFSEFIWITTPLGLLSILPLTIVQDTLNMILLSEKPELEIRKKINLFEIFLLVAGSIIWFLFFNILKGLK